MMYLPAIEIAVAVFTARPYYLWRGLLPEFQESRDIMDLIANENVPALPG
jgi:hypothetical protein